MVKQVAEYTIPAGKECQGYVWMSDGDRPELLIDGSFGGLTIRAGDIPFVVEAQAVIDGVSIGIRHVDGRFIVTEYSVADLDRKSCTTYAAHRLPGISGLSFVRIWKEEEDPLCCDFPVLMPAESVFVGFIK